MLIQGCQSKRSSNNGTISDRQSWIEFNNIYLNYNQIYKVFLNFEENKQLKVFVKLSESRFE